MCKANTLIARESAPINVIVNGAGPGGVLACLVLLGRNSPGNIKYHVTLVDNRQNYAKVLKEDLSKHRSWMIGLANHGISAIKSIPGVWEKYVQDIGVPLESFSVHVGKSEMKSVKPGDEASEGYIVDRNYIVWALTNALMDLYGDQKDALTSLYETECLYVDGRNQKMLVRSKADGTEEYLDYDILVGADGIRSVVRAAFIQNERHFECNVSDIFQRFKAVHVQRPESFHPNSAHLLPNGLPNMNGIGLPEKGNSFNISMGYARHNACDQELMSDDPKIVADYLRKHWKSCDLIDYDDFARQWTGQPWNSTGQVHCNTYHSISISAILLGDAAHATSPSIGMGMNTALADAASLNKILDECNDDWTKAMPAYSKERVREGRALSNLAYYLFSFRPSQSLRVLILGVIRETLHKYIPFISRDPQAMIGDGYKLSECYDVATKQGVLSAVRATNDTLRREWEEEQVGMVTPMKRKFPHTVAVGGALAAFAYLLLKSTS